MKGIFVIIDGVSDEPCYSLGGKTPLEAAKTPNLDKFAFEGKMDYCYTVKKDYIPESNEGVLSLLGYDSFLIPRGPLEALGVGSTLTNGDLSLRCNFASIDDLQQRNILDRRAGRTLTTREARILAKAINKNVRLNGGIKFEFIPGVQHRGALIIRGGFSDNISDVEDKNGKLVFSESMDDIDDSKLVADIVNQFVRRSYEVLDKHPINIARSRKGLFSANVLLCRGAGNINPTLKKLKGKWMALGYMPLEIGIAKATKMDIFKFRYPKLRGIDVYANLYTGLKLAIKNAMKMLKRYWKKYDYFYIHFKETDIPGHDNKPHDKINMIEIIDERFFGFLRNFMKEGILLVSADHSTACRRKAHSPEPVPVLTWPWKNSKKGVKRFTESDAFKGKRFIGKNLLKERLFLK